jgi:hypothetical protein
MIKSMNVNHRRLALNLLLTAAMLAASYAVRTHTGSAHGAGWTLAAWALAAWVGLRMILALRRARAGYRKHARQGLNLRAVDAMTTASLPAWAQGFYALEKRMYAGAWRALRRVPLHREAEFSVALGPNVAWLSAWPMVGVAAIPAVFVFACIDAGLSHTTIALSGAALFVLGLYLLAWIVGMRRILRESGLAVSLETIHIDLGLRGEACVPMAAVDCCYDASALAALAPAQVWTMTPSEEPNVIVALKGPTTIAATRFGKPVTVTASWIALYADAPVAFTDAVNNALPRRLRSFG